MISLRQLQFLVALADELHFSRAAELCNVAQPTLSSGLKELEDLLGVPVAERTKRSVILTPIGRQIAERARKVLAEVADIEGLAAREGGPLHGDLRLGTIPTIGPFLIPKALPVLRRAHPRTRLYLREELTESLVDGLLSGRLDVILIALPFEIGDAAETELLFEDDYQLATQADDPIVAQGRVSAGDLIGTPLLLLEKGHCLQRHALSAFPEMAMLRDDSFAATSLATLISMVEEGLGMTLLPQLAIDAGATRGHVVAMTPLRGACPRKVVLAWRRTSPYAEDFRALAAIFRDARAELAPKAG